MYYRKLVLQRVEHGDKDATMLTIKYYDGQSISIKFFAVSLDRWTSTEQIKDGWKSKRRCAIGEDGNPIMPIRDEIDDIIERVMETARKSGVSVWTPNLIEEHVSHVQ